MSSQGYQIQIAGSNNDTNLVLNSKSASITTSNKAEEPKSIENKDLTAKSYHGNSETPKMEASSEEASLEKKGHGLDPSTYGTYKGTDGQGNAVTLVVEADKITNNDTEVYPSIEGTTVTIKDEFTVAIIGPKQTPAEINPQLAGFIGGAGTIRNYTRLTFKDNKFEIGGFVDPDNPSGLAILAGLKGIWKC